MSARRGFWHRLLWLGALLLVLGQTAPAAVAGQSYRISQKDRAFDRKEITIAVGDTLVFANDDEFIHQIYVQSATFNFDSDESEPGKAVSLIFDKPGVFEVRCHIHPKMLLIVTVK